MALNLLICSSQFNLLSSVIFFSGNDSVQQKGAFATVLFWSSKATIKLLHLVKERYKEIEHAKCKPKTREKILSEIRDELVDLVCDNENKLYISLSLVF